MVVDLRSDTVTQPTPGMRAAMAAAAVGDDVYGEDPTTNALEAEVAALLGKEAGLFTPTGTMANQLALRCHTQPGDAVILEGTAHIRQWESGAPAALSGVTLLPIAGTAGIIDLDAAWAAADRPANVHCPPPTLIAVENTANAGGGTTYPLPLLRAVVSGAQQRGLASHCDGARLWNAAAATGLSEAELVAGFDTVSVCLSKGLGAPAGSVLVGPRSLIFRARRFRKMFGGGMRQVGILAEAGRYALANHRERLVEDHRRASQLAAALSSQGWSVRAPATNMVYIETEAPQALVARAAESGVRFGASGAGEVRLVVHLHHDDEAIARVIEVLAGLRG